MQFTPRRCASNSPDSAICLHSAVWFESKMIGEHRLHPIQYVSRPGACLMTAIRRRRAEMRTRCDGIVIDLRGNPGGIGGDGHGNGGLAGRPAGTSVGHHVYARRDAQLLHQSTRAGAYGGPVAVLVDGSSRRSTSEMFAGGLKDLGRARIFGTRTKPCRRCRRLSRDCPMATVFNMRWPTIFPRAASRWKATA